MDYDLVVVNGTLVSGDGRRAADLAVRDGLVAAVEPPGQLRGLGAQELDARGLLVLPGLIDAHVHFRQPGLEHEEDWQSGTRAAVFGGVTTVVDMPNTIPPTATMEAARHKLALAGTRAYCDYGIYGLLGPDSGAVAELVASGQVVGLKAFLGPTTGGLPAPADEQLLAGLRAARGAGLRTVFHAEDAEAVRQATADLRVAGRDDPLAHLDARPPRAEVMAIERVGRLLAESGAMGHIAHLTSAEGLAAVERCRTLGVDLTCEVTPHHALLDRDVYARHGAMAKVNPPIRGEPHASALLAALASGSIDTLASDHAPHLLSDKQRSSMWDVAAGFAGVETLLQVMLTQAEWRLQGVEDIVRATAERPAKVFGLWPKKGALEVGADCDLVIIRPPEGEKVARNVYRAPTHVVAGELHGKNNHSPWDGHPSMGPPVATVVRGRVVMRDGVLLGEPGWGRPVSRAQSPS